MSYSARKFSVGGGDTAWVVEFTAGVVGGGDVVPRMVDANDYSYWIFQGGSVVKMSPDGNVDTAIDWSVAFSSFGNNIDTRGGYVSNNQLYFANAEAGNAGAGVGFDTSLTADVEGCEAQSTTTAMVDTYRQADGDYWTSTAISTSAFTWTRYSPGNSTPQAREIRELTSGSCDWRHTNEASNGDWLFSASTNNASGDAGYITRILKNRTIVWGRSLTSDATFGTSEPYSFAVRVVEDPSDSTQMYICGGNNWAAQNPGGEVDGFDVQANLVRLTASTGATELGYQYTTTNQFVYFKDMVMDSNGDTYLGFVNSASSITGVVKINTSLASNWTIAWERSFGASIRLKDIALSPDEEHIYVGSGIDVILKLPVDGDFVGTFGPVTVTASSILTREPLQMGNSSNAGAFFMNADSTRTTKTPTGSASTITPTTSKTGV